MVMAVQIEIIYFSEVDPLLVAVGESLARALLMGWDGFVRR
jgi:hypothetical protein